MESQHKLPKIRSDGESRRRISAERARRGNARQGVSSDPAHRSGARSHGVSESRSGATEEEEEEKQREQEWRN